MALNVSRASVTTLCLQLQLLRGLLPTKNSSRVRFQPTIPNHHHGLYDRRNSAAPSTAKHTNTYCEQSPYASMVRLPLASCLTPTDSAAYIDKVTSDNRRYSRHCPFKTTSAMFRVDVGGKMQYLLLYMRLSIVALLIFSWGLVCR